MEQEIGHSEVCNSVTNQDPFTVSYPGGQSFSDPNDFDTCMGGSEGPNAVGEGPCTRDHLPERDNPGPNGPVACPTNNAASGALCEFADGYCFQKGTADRDRSTACRPRNRRDANQCFADRFQNGDLDFDGLVLPAGLAERQQEPPDGLPVRRAVHGQREDLPAGPVRDRHRRLVGPVQRCHRRGLHRPADQRQVLPVLVAQPAVSSRSGSQRTGCAWNFGNDLPNT